MVQLEIPSEIWNLPLWAARGEPVFRAAGISGGDDSPVVATEFD